MMKVDLTLGGKKQRFTPAGTIEEFEVETEGVVVWHLAGSEVQGNARTGQGLLQGLTSQLEAFQRRPPELREYLEKLEKDQRNLTGFVDQPFQQEGELLEKKTRLLALDEELKAEGNQIVSQGVVEAGEVTGETNQAQLAQDIEDALAEAAQEAAIDIQKEDE